jgi:hypothetical protein
LPITELKWDARTVTDIPGNTAYWFFVFFWQTKGDYSIGPVEQVRSKKPWLGRSKLAAVQPLWLNFRPLPVSRIVDIHLLYLKMFVHVGIIYVDQATLRTGSCLLRSKNGMPGP